MNRFRPIGAWRTSRTSQREWKMRTKPIYIVGFLALACFVAVVLSCSGGV